MLYLAIDPGETNGVAVYNAKFRLVELMSYTKPNLLTAIEKIEVKPDIALVESAPTFGDNYQISWVMAVMEALAEKGIATYTIKPSAWKPIAKANGWQVSAGKTQHEKDAFNLIRYYILITDKMDIGSI